METLDLVQTLCTALAKEGIEYCHWKSNDALDRSARGDNDLDLLVSKDDATRFSRILHDLSFKRATERRSKTMPGVLDYYGYDRPSGKLVHVHAHYHLVVGDDRTKNYRIPIERPFLASSVEHRPFRVPSPEFESILFVIRMTLKHSTWDAFVHRKARPSVAEHREWDYLQSRFDSEMIGEILQEHAPFLEESLFWDCARALDGRSSMSSRIKAASTLQQRLRPHTRWSHLIDVALKAWRRLVQAIRRRLFQSGDKQLAHGGALIAVVGGDGAGKSTAIEGICQWLGKDFKILNLHLGKPKWSWLTKIVRGTLKIGKTLGFYPFVTVASVLYRLPGDPPARFPGYPVLLRTLCDARDRQKTYIKAQRFVNRGGLVVCDRFPLPEIKLMDGPLVERLAADRADSRLVRRLAKLEESFYASISPPDVLIVLRVAPETAVRRRSEEDPVPVLVRSSEVWDLKLSGPYVHTIDASRSPDQVLSDVKSVVWRAL